MTDQDVTRNFGINMHRGGPDQDRLRNDQEARRLAEVDREKRIEALVAERQAVHWECFEERDRLASEIRQLLYGRHTEVLEQLIFGPVWDGDLCSKSARSDLADWGMCIKVCCKGEQGYNAATYVGWQVYYAPVPSHMKCTKCRKVRHMSHFADPDRCTRCAEKEDK